MDTFHDQFLLALRDYVDPYMNLPIFSDHSVIGGELYEQRFAYAIAHSVCMVMIYTPTYFDSDHNYCAREFIAMERVEEQRFSALSRYGLPTPGMIIPIILKGRPPQRVQGKRDCRYDFGQFTLRSRNIASHPHYSVWFDDIGKHIRAVWDIVRHIDWSTEVAANCNCLPGDNEASVLLDEIRDEITLPFPGIRQVRSPSVALA